MKRTPGILFVLSLMFGGFARTFATEAPSLKITAPMPGTIVRPGEEVVINVATSPPAFGAIDIHPCSHVAADNLSLSGPPYRFVLQILASAEVESGPCYLMALGAPWTGPDIVDTVWINIERSESPTRLDP